MVILAWFEASLLETKHIACKIVNKRSLNLKNVHFEGRLKHTPLVCPKLSCVGRQIRGRPRESMETIILKLSIEPLIGANAKE